MSDRVKGLVVTFDKDYKNVETLMEAIGLLKGVINVEPMVSNVADHINRMQIRNELEQKLWNALKEPADE